MTEEKVTVDRLADAKTGDFVWEFDANLSRYVNGKYEGRGVFKLARIESETRQSFIINRTKFDRNSGIERVRNGFTSGRHLFGDLDKEDFVWMDENRYRLLAALERCDCSTLRKVADLIGWRP